ARFRGRGRGRERGGVGSWCHCAVATVEALHEPSPRSGVSAERRWLLFPRIAALCRDAATPGFMAPMRGCKTVEPVMNWLWPKIAGVLELILCVGIIGWVLYRWLKK